MPLAEFIRELQRQQALLGKDATVVLYDKTNDRTLTANPDDENWDWDIMRGDNEVVIEFE